MSGVSCRLEAEEIGTRVLKEAMIVYNAVYETLAGQPRTRHAIECAHSKWRDPQALSDGAGTEQEEYSLSR
jgi:hypothetical protein